MAQNMNIFDSDAYGVNTDLPLSVSDRFNPSSDVCREAKIRFDTAMYEALTDLADMCNIPYSTYVYWDRDEWREFKECLGL